MDELFSVRCLDHAASDSRFFGGTWPTREQAEMMAEVANASSAGCVYTVRPTSDLPIVTAEEREELLLFKRAVAGERNPTLGMEGEDYILIEG